jgi:mannose-6-phosphate isomerase-like protein (cupin superfamily)
VGRPGSARPPHRAGALSQSVPVAGESFHPLATIGGARVEHIVSSDAPDTVEQVQQWDEWVLLVSGSARLELPGGLVTLGPGDWLVIPAGTPHRVRATAAGTHWIAVHAEAAGEAGEAHESLPRRGGARGV